METSPAFALDPGESRGAGPLNVLGDLLWIKVSSADSGGAVTIMETTAPPMGGPALHRHSREDEWFYVVEGQFILEVDGDQMTLGPGASAFAPRGTAHTFQNVAQTTGRLVIVAQLGGIEMFFGEIAAATKDVEGPDISSLLPIFEKYGMEFLGPPLQARAASNAHQ